MTGFKRGTDLLSVMNTTKERVLSYLNDVAVNPCLFSMDNI